MRHVVHGLLVPALLFNACAHAPATRPPTEMRPAAAQQPLPLEIRWTRRSAEHRGVFLQTFELAEERLPELTRGLAPQSWAIITDADETILDNSLFQEQQAVTHTPYSEAAWNDFVRSQVSTALPGAVEFVRRVHALGGRVVVVTNRAPEVCDVTRSNLQKDSLDADLVLCHPAPPANGDKNPRFQAVQNGTAAAGMPGLKVVMWLGDNIQDFPELGQDVRQQGDGAFAHFGRDYFLLPNPMYGSWENNKN